MNTPSCQASKVHLLQYASLAVSIANGVKAAHINIVYDDETLSATDLVIGVNTAEWSYDRAENQASLQLDLPVMGYMARPFHHPRRDSTGPIYRLSR